LKGLGFSRAVNDPRNSHPDRSGSASDGAVEGPVVLTQADFPLQALGPPKICQ